MKNEPESSPRKVPPSASVGLVQANATDALAGTRSRKVILWTVLTVFLGTLVATVAIDTLFPVPRPQPVGQEKARDVRRQAEARFRDGSLAKLAEYELRLTSRVRETVVPSYAWLLYDWMGETRGFTVAGDDGWFFLPTRIETNPRSAAEHANIGGNLIAAVSRRLHGFGSELLVVPVPRKAVVYREALPKNRPCRQTIDSCPP